MKRDFWRCFNKTSVIKGSLVKENVIIRKKQEFQKKQDEKGFVDNLFPSSNGCDKFDFLAQTKTEGSTSLQRYQLSSGKLDKLEFLFTSVRYERHTDTNAATGTGRVLRWHLSLQLA